MKKPIPVVVYLRKSHESAEAQEASIPRQREAVAAYCKKNNFRIVAEYVDQASGSKDQERRVEFQKMLLDFQDGTLTAEQVVCWNRNRFGRLDAYDGGLAVNILRKRGVILNTVREGEFDWNDSGGRWKDYALAEAGKLMSISISADSLSGRLRRLHDGWWPNGAVPYGYDRCYVNQDGTQTVIPRSKPTTRPAKSKLKLVINPTEAAIVRRLFKDFADDDTSLRQLAIKLNTEGVPPPDTLQKKSLKSQTGNHGWNPDTIKHLLRVKAYIGTVSIGATRKREREAFNRADPTEVENACPAIIEDRDLWDRVQNKFQSRMETGRKVKAKNGGPLSGFVYCGHCRFRLKARRLKGRTYYACESAVKRPHFGCRQWSVREDVVLPKVSGFIVKAIDSRLLKAKGAKPTRVNNLDILLAEKKKLVEQIDRAEDNILTIEDKTLLPKLVAKVAAWRAELGELERRVDLETAFSGATSQEQFQKWWAEARARLVMVRAAGKDDGVDVVPMEAAAFRGVLDSLGVKVYVFWDKESGYFPSVKDVVVEGGGKNLVGDRTRTTTATWSTASPSGRGS